MPGDGVIVLDPHPRKVEVIFSPEDKARLEKIAHVAWHDGSPATDAHIDALLPEMVALVGQTALPKERLDRAPNLRAICNVEGNFLPNIEYDECFRRNIAVLGCATAFAPAVAELALGLTLAAARGIVDGDNAFRAGNELYGGASNAESFLLKGQTFGLLGCGNVGRAILPLLRPFAKEILVHDPWLHPHALEDLGVTPVGLDELLKRSRVVYLIAPATTENQRGLRMSHWQSMQRGSIVLLVGRSEVVDFDEFLDAAASGQIKACMDVFPQEPLAKDHRARKTPNTILSAHRAGGIPETYRQIGRMVVDDLELVLRGLAPQRMMRAAPETVSRYRSKPVKG